jgi:hypothetical protein
VSESCVPVTITVTRTGSTAGAVDVAYRTNNGGATQRGDFTYAAGTLRFGDGETSKTFQVLITDDAYAEGTEGATIQIVSVSGSNSVGSPGAATLTIGDNESNDGPNTIDDAANFVCQHYHDFLNRQADASGQSFWTNQITSCGSDAGCRDAKRTSVSQAFFLSIEFQQTGYFVFRFYRASFPDSAGRPRGLPRYAEFLRDTQEIQRGVVIGQPGADAQLEANRQDFARRWVQRADFVAEYPESMTAEQYVDKLFQRSGVTPTTSERDAAIAAYNSGSDLPDKRARGLRSVVDSGSVYNAQYNPAFVLMQYFGYLRRNPNDLPDSSFAGFDFWLTKMNQFSQPGEDVRNEQVARARVQRAEMVRSFIVSGEYRDRFGGGANRGNDPNPTPIAAFHSWQDLLDDHFRLNLLAPWDTNLTG